jgi:hypothetical protein
MKFSHEEIWTGQCVGHIGEEVFVVGILFGTIHVFEMILSKRCGQFLHYFCILVACWLDDAQEELGWNTKPEHSVDVCPHNLEMQQRLEQFLEVEKAYVHNLDIKVSEIHLQL